MSHIQIKDAEFATRCWICGDCVEGFLYETPVHHRWIVFTKPCPVCFEGTPVPAEPMILPIDYPSTGPAAIVGGA